MIDAKAKCNDGLHDSDFVLAQANWLLFDSKNMFIANVKII